MVCSMTIILDKRNADGILRNAIYLCNKYYDYQVLKERLVYMNNLVRDFERYDYSFHAEVLRTWIKIMKANYRKKRKMERNVEQVQKNVDVGKVRLSTVLEREDWWKN